MEKRGKKRISVRIALLIAVFVLAAAAICVLALYPKFFGGGEYTVCPVLSDDIADASFLVHFIDVDQGDCILVSCDGKNMLIDAGESKYAGRVRSYLKEQGVKKIDILVGTHPHADHIGALANIVRRFDIGTILMPKISADTASFENLIDAVSKKGLKITSPDKGQKFALGSADITVLSPSKDAFYEENLNNYSIVLRVEYEEKVFLFTGDAERDVEYEILRDGADIDADVLKAGHHGSSSSSSDRFIKAVSPEYAVIMLGRDNPYGHPHVETVATFKKYRVKALRTDECGSIVFGVKDGKIGVSTEKGEKAA